MGHNQTIFDDDEMAEGKMDTAGVERDVLSWQLPAPPPPSSPSLSPQMMSGKRIAVPIIQLRRRLQGRLNVMARYPEGVLAKEYPLFKVVSLLILSVMFSIV